MDQRTNLAERLGAAEELIAKVLLNALSGENVTHLNLSIEATERGSKHRAGSIEGIKVTLRAEVKGTRD